jgi:hypothetical protein
MGITLSEFGTQTNHLQQLGNFFLYLLALCQSVDYHWFTDDFANRMTRIQRAVRILKNNLHSAAHPPDHIWSRMA